MGGHAPGARADLSNTIKSAGADGIDVTGGFVTIGGTSGGANADPNNITGNAVGIEVAGGTVTLPNAAGNSVAGSTSVGILVDGGSATIGGTTFTDNINGSNTINVQYKSGTLSFDSGSNHFYATNYYIDNETSTPVDASQSGNSFGNVTPTSLNLGLQANVDEMFRIQNEIHDALSNGSSTASYAWFLATFSFQIRRGRSPAALLPPRPAIPFTSRAARILKAFQLPKISRSRAFSISLTTARQSSIPAVPPTSPSRVGRWQSTTLRSPVQDRQAPA